MFATGKCCVWLGTGLCDGMITRPEDSYQCDLETSTMRRLKSTRVVEPEKKYFKVISERLRGGRLPQSEESLNVAIDSRLKPNKIDVDLSDQRYRVINLSLFSVSG